MRREYRAAVRESFERALTDALPGFERVKVRSAILFGGESVYRWLPGEALQCFILLVPDPKGREAFTLELGWSTLGRFPAVTARPSVVLAPGSMDPIALAEAVVRLGDVHGGADLWWQLPDPVLRDPGDIEAMIASMQPIDEAAARRDAEQPVSDAVRALLDAGVPFLESLAERHLGTRCTPRLPR